MWWSLLGHDLPRRPGTQGHEIKLRSNFFEVKHFPDEIIHYDVAISDGKTDNFPKGLNLSIIEELVRLNQNIFQRRPVYDRKKNLYSMDELPFKSKVCVNNTLKIFTWFSGKKRKDTKEQSVGTINLNSSWHFPCIQCCVH